MFLPPLPECSDRSTLSLLRQICLQSNFAAGGPLFTIYSLLLPFSFCRGGWCLCEPLLLHLLHVRYFLLLVMLTIATTFVACWPVCCAFVCVDHCHNRCCMLLLLYCRYTAAQRHSNSKLSVQMLNLTNSSVSVNCILHPTLTGTVTSKETRVLVQLMYHYSLSLLSESYTFLGICQC